MKENERKREKRERKARVNTRKEGCEGMSIRLWTQKNKRRLTTNDKRQHL